MKTSLMIVSGCLIAVTAFVGLLDRPEETVTARPMEQRENTIGVSMHESFEAVMDDMRGAADDAARASEAAAEETERHAKERLSDITDVVANTRDPDPDAPITAEGFDPDRIETMIEASSLPEERQDALIDLVQDAAEGEASLERVAQEVNEALGLSAS